MTHEHQIFGSVIRRQEDPRLLTGTATYTDDLTLPGMLHAAMLRSPHAHARIKRIDVSRAKQAPGVVLAHTGTNICSVLKAVPCAWLLPNANLNVAPYQCMGSETVRYAGDIVAVVVAETPYQAYECARVTRSITSRSVCYRSSDGQQTGRATVSSEVPITRPSTDGGRRRHRRRRCNEREIVIKERIVSSGSFRTRWSHAPRSRSGAARPAS